MSSLIASPRGEPIEVDRANVKSVKADFVKQTITLTFTLPLNQETLALRQQFAMLAASDEFPVSVSIQPMQLRLGQK